MPPGATQRADVWHLRAGLGPSGAVRKVAEVAALMWAGSQVTKLARAAGAVALAPFVDRLLVAIQGDPLCFGSFTH